MEEEKWEETVKEEELKDNVPVAVKVGKRTVLLIRSGDDIYAIGGKCSHYGASLKDGVLIDHVLTCPLHNARFDITDGRVKSPPAADDLTRYMVKVEKGIIYVKKAEAKKAPEKKGKVQKKGDNIFIIIGAGAAGNTAALTLRHEGFTGRIILLTEEGELPYDRPNLSKDFLTGEVKREWMWLKSGEHYRDMEIEVLRNYKVTNVDVKEKKVTFAHETQMRYDKLLIASGGIPKTPGIPGTDFPGFYLLRSFSDAEGILAALGQAEQVVIIGAGFIGLETASSLRKRDLEVHVVAPQLVPMAHIFGLKIGKRLKNLHEKNGVHFHLGITPEEIIQDGKTAKVLLSDQSSITAHIIIAGIGIVPAVGFIESAGLIEDGAIPVNEFLQTENKDVFAAGDVAIVPDSITGEKRRIEHWVEALRQGQHVARSMMGRRLDYTEIPFFWTRQYETSVQYVGHSKSPDTILFRGSEEGDSFVSGYYEQGRLKAAAGIQREKDIILLSEILKGGINISPAQFKDESIDLKEILMKSKSQSS